MCFRFFIFKTKSDKGIFSHFLQQLGSLVNETDLESGRVYPPVPTIHDVTVKIAAHLVEHLYKTKRAWNYPGIRSHTT